MGEEELIRGRGGAHSWEGRRGLPSVPCAPPDASGRSKRALTTLRSILLRISIALSTSGSLTLTSIAMSTAACRKAMR